MAEIPLILRFHRVYWRSWVKKAGEQVLDGLDWEIRLPEKHRIEATDRKERQVDRKEFHTEKSRIPSHDRAVGTMK